ncbi:MAG: SRPBCC domain-containing protein [Melioribacteraceae bacterium]|nr:SRPBCC domain-containing protein [Melioribacteraceae bacterium]MCF8353681.1 SRPBCC domain-containing protein [Melioribacteraceae bacterium]MCF8394463.1 SRPBCC domain-containing protein [Melioribacteraceae bacterium]MCF8418597.1 SRPBCC domain-containing protein [Melioribacteraceae bacterium]
MKNEPFVIEREYDAPIDKVWEALTDNSQIKQWYFDIAEFKPEVGFEFQFEGGKDDRRYIHLCKVTEVIPTKKLSYTWRYDGYPGSSHVIWELFDANGKTKVRLTHENLESFGTGNPDFAKENFVQGWNAILGELLKDFLEN